MKSIVIAFSLKEQNFNEIKSSVKMLAQTLEVKYGNVILIHGFMSEKEVKKRKLKDIVQPLFKKLFPVQLNMYSNGVLREEMADIAKNLYADIYVIGEVKGGVKEEVELYEKRGLRIIYMPI